MRRMLIIYDIEAPFTRSIYDSTSVPASASISLSIQELGNKNIQDIDALVNEFLLLNDVSWRDEQDGLRTVFRISSTSTEKNISGKMLFLKNAFLQAMGNPDASTFDINLEGSTLKITCDAGQDTKVIENALIEQATFLRIPDINVTVNTPEPIEA